MTNAQSDGRNIPVSWRARVSRTVLRWFIRTSLVVFAALMRVARAIGGARSGSTSGPGHMLLTGAFYSENWIAAHLDPLLRSQRCAEVTVVTLFPIAPRAGLKVVAPPAWMLSVAGRTGARLLLFLWLGVSTRPTHVGGFHLLINGLLAAFLGNLVGARSVYFCVGGPAEVLGGGIRSENRLFERIIDPDLVIEGQLLAAVRNFDLIVTMGRQAKDFFERRGVESRIAVISGALDVERYHPVDGSKAADIVFVGRLVPIKRIDLLLGALQVLAARLPACNAVIVGDGPLRQDLEALAVKWGVAERVRFVGLQADVVTWLQSARVFVLCSDSEGLSLALAEAMLCGLPAVVSNVGDLGELVETGRNGILVDGRTPEDFARALLDVLGDPDEYRAMSERARASALRFELGAVARQWDDALA